MRDYRSVDTSKTETKTIDIPNSQIRQTRRKRRTRPACERFHDLYEATGEILGQGAQGTVHCYRSKKDDIVYAVKIINKSIDYDRRKILKEIDIFHHCQGQRNILQLNEFFEEDEKFYLVFDRLKGGTLFEQIRKRGHFTEMEASQIIKDLAEAVSFLHQKGIAHRDLKPENILCETEGQLTPVRICDFDLGSSIVLQQESPVTTPELLTPVGSLEYMAPEVVDAWVGDAFSYNKKCDIWSLGIILYMMLCGYPPFYAQCGGADCGWERGETCEACQNMLFEKIQQSSFEFAEKDWSHVSSHAKNLITNMLVRDPSQRYSAEQVLAHTWVKDPVPPTYLATPQILSRNSSSFLACYENAMAFNRMMVSQLTISESKTSVGSCHSGSSSTASFNPFFSPSISSGSANFVIGEFSDEEDEEDSVVPVEQNTLCKESRRPSLQLSLPSSKLAQRRRSRHI